MVLKNDLKSKVMFSTFEAEYIRTDKAAGLGMQWFYSHFPFTEMG